MKIVLNLMKCKPGSIIASNRIARFIAGVLECPLIDDGKLARKAMQQDIDTVFFVNGPMLYCDFRDEVKSLVDRAKEVVWIGNDITIMPPPFVKQHGSFISICAYENFKNWPNHALVNWNCLTYTPIRTDNYKNQGLVYYGAFREDRLPYFEKYLKTDKYPVWISSSKTGEKKFAELCPDARFFTPKSLLYGLREFQATIYIEDQKSHTVYSSPANRFYECASAGILQLFDRSCLNTMNRAQIDVTPWVVDSADELADCLAMGPEFRQSQLDAFRSVDYRAELEKNFRRAAAQLLFLKP